MKTYEVRFDSEKNHPLYVDALDVDDAIRKALDYNNAGTKHKKSFSDVVVCSPTNKIPVVEAFLPYTRAPAQGPHVSLPYIESHLSMIREYGELILEPDFQRAHVWTEEQQKKYVEHILRGGTSGREIYFNSPEGWDKENNCAYPTVLVDGLQRLTALRKFMRDELPLTGGYVASSFRYLSQFNLIFIKNNLKNYSDVLRWYLEMNSGGTPHTEEELEKVRKMLKNV